MHSIEYFAFICQWLLLKKIIIVLRENLNQRMNTDSYRLSWGGSNEWDTTRRWSPCSALSPARRNRRRRCRGRPLPLRLPQARAPRPTLPGCSGRSRPVRGRWPGRARETPAGAPCGRTWTRAGVPFGCAWTGETRCRRRRWPHPSVPGGARTLRWPARRGWKNEDIDYILQFRVLWF